MSARSWCFTLNNYTLAEIAQIESIPYRYLIYGYEIGDNGTPHLQGYIEFANPLRFAKIKSYIPRAHIEQRRGSRDEARNYCMKDNEFIELGDWNVGGQGRRNDLDFIRNLVNEEGMAAVAAIGNLQQIRVAEKYLQYNEEPRDSKPEVIWLWGKTGVGKSRMARKLCDDYYYSKKDGTKWWDRYDAHENVIIDDFRDSWWSLTTMLSLLDRYEHVVETKGGTRQFVAKKIIITSSIDPKLCYKNCGEDVNQLLRRIDYIEEMSNIITMPAVPGLTAVPGLEALDSDIDVDNILCDIIGQVPDLKNIPLNDGDIDNIDCNDECNKVGGVILATLPPVKNVFPWRSYVKKLLDENDDDWSDWDYENSSEPDENYSEYDENGVFREFDETHN